MKLIDTFIEEIFFRNLWITSSDFEKNEILVDYGEISDEVFFFVSGAAVVTAEIEEKEQIIRLGYKNSMMVCADSFLNNTPTRFQIKTIRKSKVLKSKRPVLQKIFDETPEMFGSLLTELINQYTEREIDLLYQSAQTRYERLLNRSPQVFQEIPHKYIASYLRISPETLSRLQKS